MKNLNNQHLHLHQYVDLNIFLPNGFFIQLSTENDRTLNEIKHDIWNELEQMIEKISKKIIEQNQNHYKNNNRLKRKNSLTWLNNLSTQSLKRKLSFSFKLRQKSIDLSSSSSSQKTIKRTTSLNVKEKDDNDNDDAVENEENSSTNDSRIKLKQLLFNSIDDDDDDNQKQINLIHNDDIINESIFLDNDKLPLKLLSFINNDHCDYSFQSITNTWEEIYDDNNHLYELNEQIPYYLRLVELTNDKNEKLLNSRIKQIIKCSVNKLDVYRTDEFYDYRFSMYQCMIDSIKQREKFSIDKRINYEFEPELDEIDSLNLSVQTIIKKFHLDEIIDLSSSNKDNDDDLNLWSKSLENYFNYSFPYMQKHRRKNFNTTMIHNNNNNNNNSNNKNIDNTKTPGAYSPYHRKSNDNNQLQKEDEAPLYTEVDVVPKLSIKIIDGKNNDDLIIINNNVKTSSNSNNNKISKHKRHLHSIKHRPLLTPVFEEEECINNNNNNNNIDTKNKKQKNIEYLTINFNDKQCPRKFNIKIYITINLIIKCNNKNNNDDSNENIIINNNNNNEYDDDNPNILDSFDENDDDDDDNDNDEKNDGQNDKNEIINEVNQENKTMLKKFVRKLSLKKIKKNDKIINNDDNQNDNVDDENDQNDIINNDNINKHNENKSIPFLIKTYSNKNARELIQKLLLKIKLFIENDRKINSSSLSSSSSSSSSILSLRSCQRKFKSIQENLIQTITKSNHSTTNNNNNCDDDNNNNDKSIYDLNVDSYLLKICGYDQYLIGDYPLIRFEYIRNCISIGKIPNLCLIRKEIIIKNLLSLTTTNCNKLTIIEPSFLRRLHQYTNTNVNNLNTINDESPKADISYRLTDGFSSKGRFYFNNNNNNTNNNNNRKRKQIHNRTLHTTSLCNDNENNDNDKNDDQEYCHYSTITHVIDQQQQRNLQSPSIIVSSDENNVEIDYCDKVCDDDNDFYLEFIYDNKTLDSWIYRGIYEKQLLKTTWQTRRLFRLRILSASYVNVKLANKIFIRMALCHGNELLSDVHQTDFVESHTPLSAKLSLELCITNSRRDQDVCPIGWINLPLFNYRHCLLSGRISLTLWPMKNSDPNNHNNNEQINNDDNNNNLNNNNNETLSTTTTASILSNRLGLIGSNPIKDSAPRLDLEFDQYNNQPIVYPPKTDIFEYAQIINKQEGSIRQQFLQKKSSNKKESFNLGTSFSVARVYSSDSNELKLKQLRKSLSKRDPFTEMSEQEKDFFWRERHIILELCPDALPKIVEAVNWMNRDEVCQFYALIDRWPIVSVDIAIILLGNRYPDPTVRSFAIKCLDYGLTDQLMLHYLLQLVQLIPNETYLNNDLSRLLLRRSLLNRRFGNLFFWHIRSRLSEQYFSPRWSVLLEMYCRGLSEKFLLETLHQVSALEEIENISLQTSTITERKQAILKRLQQPNSLNIVNGFYNPLDITLRLDRIKIENLRVMDSAKRPLWLEWLNCDQSYFSKINAIIFKSGDDLRQDMLTLQVIRIMDQIWRRKNLDLRMLPYNCLATGDQVGLIEVVPNAKTVMSIQRVGGRKAALQIDSSKLYKWICEHNKDNDNYDNAVENFTRSCAGYCVATFILGIGDRNPDNIMVNEDGQIFHIDFGHFLGHFKKKFGINRERVPFVLTYDFLQVIAKGAENPLKSKEFETFQKLCNDAYLALHDNAALLISLFTMMLGTGIPELQTMDDIQYLRQTLQIDRSRKEALQYFEQQLDDAYGGAWSTKLDWFFHSVKHA